MRIILTADTLQPQLTGIGRYTFELAKGLQENSDIEKLYLYSSGILRQDPAFFMKHSLKKPFSRLKYLRLFFRYAYHRLNPVVLKGWMKFLAFDLYHAPNFILQDINLPAIATIHDLTFIHYPEFHPKDRVKFLTDQLPKTLDRATHLITDSEFVRSELISLFNVSPEKITAIPLGVQQSFKPRGEEETKETLQKHMLSYSSYLLSVATIEPRKNFANLLRAYSQLPTTLQQKNPLILVGSRGWLSDKFHEKIIQLENRGVLKYLGYVTEKELQHLYSAARGFVYPSFYEGFGLPVLEGMASGIPVLTANSSSLSEVSGGATILVSPDDVDNIAKGIKTLLELDGSPREEAIKKGLAFSSTYTWSECVRKTIAVYKKVLG